MFNDWMLDQIVKYLTYNERCVVEKQYRTTNGTQAIIMDISGNRYEITVKAINPLGVENEFFNKNDFVVFPETQRTTKHE